MLTISGKVLYPVNRISSRKKLNIKKDSIALQMKTADCDTMKILKSQMAEIDELLSMCTDDGVAYMPGQIASRIKSLTEMHA